jgi:hypothetical protein
MVVISKRDIAFNCEISDYWLRFLSLSYVSGKYQEVFLWSLGKSSRSIGRLVRFRFNDDARLIVFQTGEARYNTPSDSGIWVLADIRQLLLGDGLQQRDGFDSKEFRSQIREIISNLPTLPANDEPIEPDREISEESLSVVATEMMTLADSIYKNNVQ